MISGIQYMIRGERSETRSCTEFPLVEGIVQVWVSAAIPNLYNSALQVESALYWTVSWMSEANPTYSPCTISTCVQIGTG